MDVFETIRNDPQVEELIRLLAAGTGAVAAEGLWGSSAPVLAALAAERLGRPLLLVTAHADDADDIRDDIETAIGTAPDLLPQLDTLPQEAVGPDELASERLRLCLSLMDDEKRRRGEAEKEREGAAGGAGVVAAPIQVVAPVMALMQPVPSAEAIRARSYSVAVGDELYPDRLARWLGDHGFQRCDAVEVPGDFARRGGIVDVFCSAHTDPVRIEFFGDEVSSIRLFDTGTQRSSHTLAGVQIPALAWNDAGKDAGPGATALEQCGAGESVATLQPFATRSLSTSFLALLPRDTIIAFQEPGEIQELGCTYLQRLGERAGVIPVEAIFRRANDFAQLHLQRFAGVAERSVRFDVSSLPQFEARSADALKALGELAETADVVVLCDNSPEEQRFHEMCGAWASGADGDAGPRPDLHVRTEVGVIHHGFQWRRTAYVPHHELFHRYRQRRTLRRVQPARPIDSFFDLQTGDYVVHALHGIGRFLGLKTLDREGRVDEYLALEFAGKAVVHVPISQIHFVQKYIGSVRGHPKLSKVGGQGWRRAKQRVAEAVTDLAAELLAVQARRAAEAGVAYPRDTEWQREFEGSFLYTETEDQLRALDEVKLDMGRARPMDRLLCGDVGYGKTELALRAAFKVVEYGKQVAVLVPTTVLAEQHHQTFRERMADYPFEIEVLSRFRTKAEQARIVARARRGEIDVLIGTHRLLSPDVRFADLGLVVIDEEQRFGVEAKERLKRLRATVDLLTLTATPIPRTLHMAMLGIRDISSLATPPVDRRAIVTQVRLWDD